MKTYTIVVIIVLALGFVSCEKSSEEVSETLSTFITADYTVFLKNNNRLSVQFLSSTDDGLMPEPKDYEFVEIPSNALNYRNQNTISYYYTTNCKAKVQVYNAFENTGTLLEVFKDLDVCSITVTGITHTQDYIILSYLRELEGKDRQLMLRFIFLTAESGAFTDISLDKKPMDMVTSFNRLFVLTVDGFNTNTSHLQVIDILSKSSLMELDLGNNATKLFLSNSGDIIVGYPKLHTTVDPITLDKKYTNYGENTEPGFIGTNDSFMDSLGRLYFQKTVTTSSIDRVPAVYDFDKNKIVIYLFENFLNETELNIKYNIASTTAIGYDKINDLMLIGYQKNTVEERGGILRIHPAPNFKIIDNIDFEGIPQTIFTN